MSAIRTLIVDDEVLAREMIAELLAGDSEIEIIGECGNGLEALMMIQSESPDLVFLDIQMPDLDGFSLIERVGLKQMPMTIFVTAFDRYALRAFTVHALDYLLKPFDHERFYESLERAKFQLHNQGLENVKKHITDLLTDLKFNPRENKSDALSISQKKDYRNRLAVKSNGRLFFLKVKEINWIEAAGDYVHLHTDKKSHLIREKIGDIAIKLDPEMFLRIHRSTIVNIELIKDIQPLFKGEYIVTLTNDKQLNLSRGYRDKLQRLLEQKF